MFLKMSFYLVLILTSTAVESLNYRSFKIVGGKEASIKDHPYQVSIGMLQKHVCGGSLISSSVVLTAAHCMKYRSKFYSVTAGSSILKDGGKRLPVKVFRNHPKYRTKTHDYDVSVVKLNGAFKLGDNIQIIGLIPFRRNIKDGTLGVITGWGNEQEGVEKKLNILQKVEVPKFNKKKCEKLYSKQNQTITNRMVCYGFDIGEKDSCQGDSGGALVIKYYQAAIVSWGRGCADPEFPGVYTDLTNIEIRKHIFYWLRNFTTIRRSV